MVKLWNAKVILVCDIKKIKMLKQIVFTILLLGFTMTIFAQDVSLFNQYSGHIDFTMFGNTLNPSDNSISNPCTINTSSSADLNLDVNDTVEAAFLYWSGSGSGDLDIELNGQQISAQRTFADTIGGRPVFSAFADITNQILSIGNDTYTVSELDLTAVIGDYCGNQTNFGGWAVILVYSNPALPINQINIYDGLQSVSNVNNNLTIQLDNLLVLDNVGAKVGFLAWEGDLGLAVLETLTVNGNVLSNPPLNPANNVFNGTNSFTNSSDLYNMDLDVYDIENYINIGDTSATIELTSGQDFVMINCVAVKLNSQLPDATVNIDNTQLQNCNNREISIDFTVYNTNASNPLPANTPISVYANSIYLTTFFTQNELPIDGFETFSETVSIPNSVPNTFDLMLIVDDDNSTSTVFELNENNNTAILDLNLPQIPVATVLDTQITCDNLPNTNDGIGDFDTSQIQDLILVGDNLLAPMTISYFDENGNALSNPLPNPFTTESQSITAIIENNLETTCQTTITINFEVIALPVFDIFDAELCLNFLPEPLIISIENPQDNYNYEWQHPNGNQIGDNSDFVAITEAGLYSVIATTQDGLDCATTKTFLITETEVLASFPNNLLECNTGFEQAIFNLESTLDDITTDVNLDLTFFTSVVDLNQNINEIIFPNQFTNTSHPQTIYVRVENPITQCYKIVTFLLEVENCIPFVPSGFSPNGDQQNDTFTVIGLQNIFVNFTIEIYNRYGNIIFKGRNGENDWDGTYKGKTMPSGTYFYVLNLNDPLYSPIKGWVYLNR
jgi:gliding motility-associated-like protein